MRHAGATYLSFAGTVTFKQRRCAARGAGAGPAGPLQVETDAPYLTPTPYRGRPNASYLVPLTVRAIAEVKGRRSTQLCAALAATAERLYGPW